MMNKLITVSILCCYTHFVLADVLTARIRQIDTRPNGNVAIYLKSTTSSTTVPFPNPEACDVSDRAMIDVSDPQSKDMIAAALLSFSDQNNVKINIHDCVVIAGGTTSAPKIQYLSPQNLNN